MSTLLVEESTHGYSCLRFGNRFLRAVAYRWLARWLFGEMGWENTRSLSACIYNHIRKTLPTDSTLGYSSGQERAPHN